MLMPAFLLRSRANCLENLHGYPSFSLWIPISLAKIYFFRGPNLAQKPLYLVGTILKPTFASVYQEGRQTKAKGEGGGGGGGSPLARFTNGKIDDDGSRIKKSRFPELRK